MAFKVIQFCTLGKNTVFICFTYKQLKRCKQKIAFYKVRSLKSENKALTSFLTPVCRYRQLFCQQPPPLFQDSPWESSVALPSGWWAQRCCWQFYPCSSQRLHGRPSLCGRETGRQWCCCSVKAIFLDTVQLFIVVANLLLQFKLKICQTKLHLKKCCYP